MFGQRKDRISWGHKSSASATPGDRKGFQPEDMTASKVLTKERKKTNDQVGPLKEDTYPPQGKGEKNLPGKKDSKCKGRSDKLQDSISGPRKSGRTRR